MSQPQSPIARALLLTLMTVGVLGFGAVGLCGGYFTVTAVPWFFKEGGAVISLLALSVPCLIGGFYMVRVCVREIVRVLRKLPAGDDPL